MKYTCPKCGLTIEGENIILPVRCCDATVVRTVPSWAQAIARWAQPGEMGVGDTFHRLAAKVGANHVSRLIEWFGIECGCEGRRDLWNALYRYDANGKLV